MSSYIEHRHIQEAVNALNSGKCPQVFCLMPDALGDDAETIAEWYESETKKVADLILRKNEGDIEMAYVEVVEKLRMLYNKDWFLETAREAEAEIMQEVQEVAAPHQFFDDMPF